MQAIDRNRAEQFLYLLFCWLTDTDALQLLADAEDNRDLFVKHWHDWHEPHCAVHRIGGVEGYALFAIGYMPEDKRQSAFSHAGLWNGDEQLYIGTAADLDGVEQALWLRTQLHGSELRYLQAHIAWVHQHREIG